MDNKLIIVAFLLIGLFSISCESKDSVNETQTIQSVCDQDIIMDAATYNSVVSSPVVLTNLQITGNCLRINYGASGCDGNTWMVKLISDGAIDNTTTPASRNIKFILENNELCAAALQKEKSFNITSLKKPGTNSVKLKFPATGQEVIYNY